MLLWEPVGEGGHDREGGGAGHAGAGEVEPLQELLLPLGEGGGGVVATVAVGHLLPHLGSVLRLCTVLIRKVQPKMSNSAVFIF